MLQIPLTPETEAVLRQRANEQGQDVAAYAACVLQDALAAPNVDELLAPLRRQVDESGATDEQLDNLCDELRQDVWQEQQARGSKKA